VTQRGVDRRETFSSDADRETYLGLLRQNLADAGVGVLAWCLMTNHVHLIAMPEREDSLSVLLRRVHGRYAQYYNARWARSGHLWQNRYFACSLGPGHLWAALAYVEMNPVRAGLVMRAGDYRWSSAAAHLGLGDAGGLVDLEWWRREYDGVDWAESLGGQDLERSAELRRCTYAGRPFGDDGFVKAVSEQFGRHWVRGRPRKEPAIPKTMDGRQLAMFAGLT
jgi:putative transposase